MTAYMILCYKDSFESYRKTANDVIRAIPAKREDEFALLTCVNSEQSLGFDVSEKSQRLLGSLFKSCYTTCGEKMAGPTSAVSRYSSSYAFKPKCHSFGSMIEQHENFEINTKKFQIMSRHGRSFPRPGPTPLTAFLKNSNRPISQELYQELMKTCHYVAIEAASGEHGYGAFEVFSENLDVFFQDLTRLMDDSGELIFVSHSQIPYV
jgi:hypothetical protein